MKKDNLPEEQNGKKSRDEERHNAPKETPEAALSSQETGEDGLPVTLPDQPEMTDELTAVLEEEKAEKDTAGDAAAEEEAKASKKERREKPPRDPRKFRFGAMSTTLTVIVIAAVVLLNVVMDVLAERFPLTADLTSEKTYSLTDVGIEVARKLENNVDITVFMNEDFFKNPSMSAEVQNTVLRQFYQMSRELITQSGNKVSLTYVDLTKDPTKAQSYADYDVTYGDILFVSGARSKKVTIDNLISASGSQYTGYTYTSLVEQTLASGCNAVGNGEVARVTLLTGHQEEQNSLYAAQFHPVPQRV